MSSNQSSAKQAVISAVLAAAGAVALAGALLRDRSALAMGTGVEGSLTACVVGIALALSEGVAFATAASMALPIFLMQWLACRNAGEPALGMLGLEGILIGLLGLIAPVRVVARALSAAPPRSAGGIGIESESESAALTAAHGRWAQGSFANPIHSSAATAPRS